MPKDCRIFLRKPQSFPSLLVTFDWSPILLVTFCLTLPTLREVISRKPLKSYITISQFMPISNGKVFLNMELKCQVICYSKALYSQFYPYMISLTQGGVSPNFYSQKLGLAPIHVAAHEGESEMLALLIQYKVQTI